jgi:hypothetical protein
MRPTVVVTAPPPPASGPAPPPRAPAGEAPSRGPRTGLGCAPADRGSISVLVIFFAIIALALASLLVDVGNALNARERAADIAEQAARAGANDIDVAALRAGVVQIDTSTACGRAASLVAAYGASSGFSATAQCASVSPQQITITVSVTTKPLIAASLGNFTVHASATAEPVCGVTRGGQC